MFACLQKLASHAGYRTANGLRAGHLYNTPVPALLLVARLHHAHRRLFTGALLLRMQHACLHHQKHRRPAFGITIIYTYDFIARIHCLQ